MVGGAFEVERERGRDAGAHSIGVEYMPDDYPQLVVRHASPSNLVVI